LLPFVSCHAQSGWGLFAIVQTPLQGTVVLAVVGQQLIELHLVGAFAGAIHQRVNAGVYIVNVNGKAFKVLVK